MKKRGKRLMAAGALLVLAALLLTAVNLWEERAAERASDAVLSVLEQSIAEVRAQNAAVSMSTTDETPVLHLTDPFGNPVEWPMDARGVPTPWPLDETGEPVAELTDASGSVFAWSALPSAEWPTASDGSLLPCVTDAQGRTAPWPTENGLPVDWSALTESWRDLVERLYQEILDQAAQPAFVRNPQMPMPTLRIDGNDYIGVLDVPSKGLSLPIMSEWSDSALRVAPCRYAGSAYSGDLVIAGHNYARHFSPVKRLNPGDKVDFTDADGNAFHYVVSKVETLAANEVARMTAADGWDLTLFTCNTGGSRRVAVRCTLESYERA